MKKILFACLGTLPLLSTGVLLAHHSLANHDTTTAIRVKGTVVQIHRINPHSFVYIEQAAGEGAPQRWAIEGPSGMQLARRGDPTKDLKAGDVIEVCGYALKERTIWQIASADPGAASLAGRLLTAELLILPDGSERSWGDYGIHRCFPPGYRDQHSR